MSVYLVKTTEQYRCDTENEAKILIEDAKQNNMFTLVKYNNEIKTAKSKGEVVDEWRRVTLVKEFTLEKDPLEQIKIIYQTGDNENEY